jgi:hypothetical protein
MRVAARSTSGPKRLPAAGEMPSAEDPLTIHACVPAFVGAGHRDTHKLGSLLNAATA